MNEPWQWAPSETAHLRDSIARHRREAADARRAMRRVAGCPRHVLPGVAVAATPFDENRRYIELGTARIEFILNHENGRAYLYAIGPSRD